MEIAMANNGGMTAYINPQSSPQFRNVAGYTLADGSPAINVVCIFAGNYAAAESNPPTTQPFNENIQQVLDDGSVQYLQGKGLTVLLTITNGWQAVGWSEFTSESDALDFAQYLKTDVVDKYGLDGIDIDDEYSTIFPLRLARVSAVRVLFSPRVI
jgi:chitinase